MPQLTKPVVAPGSLARLPQPVLKVDDLVLRPWQPSDAAAVVQAYSEPSIQQWHVRSMSEDEARAWIDAWPGRWSEESGGGWAIANASGVLGQISLRRLSLAEGLGELSYWVLPEARGQRVATRALCTLTAWAFDELKLHRLELAHSVMNPESCRVAVNAGYLPEGTRRREGLHADGWHDMHFHARLIADLPRGADRVDAAVGVQDLAGDGARQR
jgi:RimJ/RimL family protein N-acetyltransferase